MKLCVTISINTAARYAQNHSNPVICLIDAWTFVGIGGIMHKIKWRLPTAFEQIQFVCCRVVNPNPCIWLPLFGLNIA